MDKVKRVRFSEAPEGRERVAPAVRPGDAVSKETQPRRGDRDVRALPVPIALPPLRGWRFGDAGDPGLTPWATFCRPSGAKATPFGAMNSGRERRPTLRAAFTLIELLVVIAIIVVLIGLIIVAVPKAL